MPNPREGANKSHVCSASAYGLGCKAWFAANGLVLCKKHNTAGRPVSYALRGFHSNRLSALSDFDMPRHAFSQMP
ncbi:hypothetical protein TUM17377_32970 [Shewanella chilikensis]|nr:hypothetical protein TUM17377_32970 [Shewanella chilikensis]